MAEKYPEGIEAAKRETWGERGLEEKVEILRSEVRALTQSMSDVLGMVYQTRSNLREHRHLESGEPVISMGASDRPMMGAIGRRDPLA